MVGASHQSCCGIPDAFARLRRTSPLLDISICELDFTEQTSDLWNHVETCLPLQLTVDATSYMYSGAGCVAWIRDGLVVDSVVNAHHTGMAELVQRSILAFPNRIQNGGKPCRATEHGMG